MVISGTNVSTFEEANFATLREFHAEGEWQPASTNHSWDLFWCEVTAYDGARVELAKRGGETFEIQEDGRGEFIFVEQEHRGLFLSGTYKTRLRPFMETSRTDRKPWNPATEGRRQQG